MFHRIDNVAAMPSRKFCRLAYRIGVYGGVVAHMAEQAEKERESAGHAGVTDDPMFAGLIEHSTAGRG